MSDEREKCKTCIQKAYQSEFSLTIQNVIKKLKPKVRGEGFPGKKKKPLVNTVYVSFFIMLFITVIVFTVQPRDTLESQDNAQSIIKRVLLILIFIF